MPDLQDSPATIFIAEDNPILLQGLDRALCANGYTVETAKDGSAMLELLAAAEAEPDLVLLDVMMPGMSGLEVLRALQAEPRWMHLPVMLITAATDEALSVAAQQSGAVDVLIKPFRLGDLLARVATHVGRSRGESRALLHRDAIPS